MLKTDTKAQNNVKITQTTAEAFVLNQLSIEHVDGIKNLSQLSELLGPSVELNGALMVLQTYLLHLESLEESLALLTRLQPFLGLLVSHEFFMPLYQVILELNANPQLPQRAARI